MLALFERAARSILSVLGEDALFNGAAQTKINIENGVDFMGTDDGSQRTGDMTMQRDVATVLSELNPKTGDAFRMVHAVAGDPGTFDAPLGSTYRLERLVKDNGPTRQYVVLRVA